MNKHLFAMLFFFLAAILLLAYVFTGLPTVIPGLIVLFGAALFSRSIKK